MSTTAGKNVPRLFDNKSVFITGVTGMLGKVLVEKMLRSTPKVRIIYVLIRPNSTGNAQTRLVNELFSSKIWDRLRDTPRSEGGFGGDHASLQAHLRRKIVAIGGDLLVGIEGTNDGGGDGGGGGESKGSPSPPLPLPFGISSKWLERLNHEGIDIVFHNAATVNFDEQIDMSVRLNILAPLQMMRLAKKWRCSSYVHVSTAYVVAHHKTKHHSPERLDVSPKQLNPDDLIEQVLESANRIQNRTKEKRQLYMGQDLCCCCIPHLCFFCCLSIP